MDFREIVSGISGGVNPTTLFKLIAPNLKERIVKELVKEVFGDPPTDYVQLDRSKFEQTVRNKIETYEKKIIEYIDKKEEKK